MSSILQTTDNEKGFSDFATKFMKRLYLGRLLFKCNQVIAKRVGISDSKCGEDLDMQDF